MESKEVLTRSHANQNHKSSIVFKQQEASTTRDVISKINPEEHIITAESIKQLTANLSNMVRMSIVNIPEVHLNTPLDHTKEVQLKNRSTFNSDELITELERGSTRRSTTFFDPVVPRIHSGVSGRASTSQIRLSDNVAVRNMPLDLPPSEDLSSEEADTYADILEKVLDQLELIRYTMPAEVDPQWDESYKTMEEKYSLKTPEELESNLKGEPALASSVVEKLQRDRTYIYNVLNNIVNDLHLRKRYDSLEKEVDNIAKTSEAQHSLEINYEIWTEQLKQLSDLIDTEKKDSEMRVKKLLAMVHESAANIENSIFLCDSKLDYVEKWEEARLEQQKLRLEMKEQALQEDLSECMKMERVDEIVSGELKAFLRADTAKMEEEIETWMARYNQEIDEHQREIDHMNEIIKDEKEALEKKYKLRDKRQAFIDECEAEREEQAKENEYWIAIHRAATIIQALWRGHMVRHQLGRFKGLKARLKKRKRLAAKKKKKRAARLKKLQAQKTPVVAKKRK